MLPFEFLFAVVRGMLGDSKKKRMNALASVPKADPSDLKITLLNDVIWQRTIAMLQGEDREKTEVL